MSAALSYSDAYARLDANRRVLICEVCQHRAPWVDVGNAVVRGWAWEDRHVDGERRRFWRCSTCKKPEPMVPAMAPPPRISTSTLSPAALDLAFGGRRVVIVQLGKSAGTQFAIVLEDHGSELVVTGWLRSSRRWTKPKTILADRIIGTAAHTERSTREALAAWPPPWMATKRRGKA